MLGTKDTKQVGLKELPNQTAEYVNVFTAMRVASCSFVVSHYITNIRKSTVDRDDIATLIYHFGSFLQLLYRSNE